MKAKGRRRHRLGSNPVVSRIKNLQSQILLLQTCRNGDLKKSESAADDVRCRGEGFIWDGGRACRDRCVFRRRLGGLDFECGSVKRLRSLERHLERGAHQRRRHIEFDAVRDRFTVRLNINEPQAVGYSYLAKCYRGCSRYRDRQSTAIPTSTRAGAAMPPSA